MNKSVIIFLFNLLCVNSLISQGNSKSLNLDELNITLELYQEDLGTMQFLYIKNTSGDLIKTISIDNEYDPYHFTAYYQGERKFAVIGGRYQFYLINVSNYKLIGPYSACCRIEPEDAQTGVLYAYKIIHDGQYLLVNALDNGLTCFNLLDLYNPKEVDFFKSDSIFYHGKYVFVDNRKENIFNGIVAECGNYVKEIDSKVLFHGYRFELDDNEKIMYKITSDRTLILNQIDRDSNIIELKIDLEEGELKNLKYD